MGAVLREVTQRLASAHRTGCRLSLLSDYDGTLTPIVEHPSLARLEQSTRSLLQCLARQPNVGVGIISGRGLTDLRHLVGLPGLSYAGTSGLELDLHGTHWIHPRAEAQRGLVEEIVQGLAQVALRCKGAWVEDKRLGLTLHYRQVAPEQLAGLWDQAGRVLGPYQGKVRLDKGAMVWEVTPALGWDKGTALRMMVKSFGQPGLALYAGDGANDAAAYEAVGVLGGISIGVGADAPPTAHWRLRDPDELVLFLGGLAEALDGHRPVRKTLAPFQTTAGATW
jgi:trehalose 6-phosphate phosphatase